MSDGKRPASNKILYAGRGPITLSYEKNWHLQRPYYSRCGMNRPAKTRQQHRWNAFILGQLIKREVYATSSERHETFAIGAHLARKLGNAYRVFYITIGAIIGLFFFGTIHGLANPGYRPENAPGFKTSRVSLPVQLSACDTKMSLKTPPDLNECSMPGLQRENALNDFTGDTIPTHRFDPTGLNISGKVTEAGTSKPLNSAKIVVVNELNAKRTDSTYTNTEGQYTLNVTWTKLPDVEYLKEKSYPNPYTDKTNIEIYSPRSENYSLQIFDITGKLILNQDLELRSGTNKISLTGGKPGVNIISLTNGKEKHTYKAVKTQGTNNPLSAQVTREEGVDAISSNSYSNTSNGVLKSGTPLEITVLNEGDLVRLKYTKLGYYDTDTLFVISQNQTINKQMEKIYSHYINGFAKSSIAGKKIKDNSQIYVVKAGTDTVWVSTTNGAFNYSWSDKNPITNVKVGGRNIPGHKLNEVTANIDDNENVSITFRSLSSYLDQPVRVKNQYGDPVKYALITWGTDLTQRVYTYDDGSANIRLLNLETDINNLPLSNYSTLITVLDDGETIGDIQTLNQTINSNVGTNAEQLLSVIQEYTQFLWGNSTSPTGTTVKAWKDGTAVQTATVNGTSYETNKIKRTTKTFIADSVTFEKAGYITFKENNVVLVDGGNKKEATLEQPVTHHFLIKPKTIDGDDINTLTLDFKWADNTITHHSIQPDGYIHVDRIENLNPTKTALVTHIADTAKYSTWQIFRKENHNLADTNYARNIKLETAYLPAPETPLKLENIPETLILYLPPTKVKTPGWLTIGYPTQYQDSIRMDAHEILGIMGGRSPPVSTTKFVPTPKVPVVDIVQFLFNETTGALMPQTQIDRAKTILDKILSLYTLNDGTKLLNYKISTINSKSDPIWQTIVARAGENCAYTTFYNGSIPYNGTVLTFQNSINNKNIIKTSSSEYGQGESDGTLFEEMYQQFTNTDDPISGTIEAHIRDPSGEVSDLGKTMLRMIYFLNQGTTTTKIR